MIKRAPDYCINRWYKLIPHKIQLALVHDDIRFKICAAGRRSGKTERAKRKLVKEAMRHPGRDYFAGAPTINQAKRIYWDDLKALSFSPVFPKPPSETQLKIYFPNGSSISVLGLDKPERFEGQSWAGGVIDEIADVKETAWKLNIAPALDTKDPRYPDYKAWCWLIGVPDGLNHFYDLAEKAKLSSEPDSAFYTWFSSDILPPDTIEAAKRRMSPKQFRQEYEASFETAAGKVYADFSSDNYTDVELDSAEPIMWMHDFNYTPLSSAIGIKRDDCLYLVDEIVLESAVSRQSALEFVEKYKDHGNKNVTVYGDPSGKAGEKHGHRSDYTEMELVLKEYGWEVSRKVKAAAPAIRDRQNAVRAKIRNAADEVSLFVNPNKCTYVCKGLNTTQIKEGSTFIEMDSPYQHITTAIGYCVNWEWPITMETEVILKPMVPQTHFYNV